MNRAQESTRLRVDAKRQTHWVAYGDIASRSYLGNKSFNGHIRAVVSPDDTFLSVGGGVAVALANNAGMRATLHEVSKFVPVPQCESRITSAGFLPVHYIIHAATIEVANDGYRVNGTDVRNTFKDILRRAAALGVDVLSVPLLATGVAGLLPKTHSVDFLRATTICPMNWSRQPSCLLSIRKRNWRAPMPGLWSGGFSVLIMALGRTNHGPRRQWLVCPCDILGGHSKPQSARHAVDPSAAGDAPC